MSRSLIDDPLAQSVLRHLAGARSKDEPLRVLARAVLTGESTIQGAARNAWIGEGVATASSAALTDYENMTVEQRAEAERGAAQLRDRAHDAEGGVMR
jgi:hypothetical protein